MTVTSWLLPAVDCRDQLYILSCKRLQRPDVLRIQNGLPILPVVPAKARLAEGPPVPYGKVPKQPTGSPPIPPTDLPLTTARGGVPKQTRCMMTSTIFLRRGKIAIWPTKYAIYRSSQAVPVF
jgi:hypothetical protein